MLPFDSESRARWARLPEAEPPARLREAVLAAGVYQHRAGSARAVVFATAAVAALFVLAVSGPLRMHPSSAVDPTVAILRAQGLEVLAPPSQLEPSEVRRVAVGSPAARVGLRVGDRLLAVDTEIAAGGMMNVAVLRGKSPRYFALPDERVGGRDSGAGMALAPMPRGYLPSVNRGHATAMQVATSLLQMTD